MIGKLSKILSGLALTLLASTGLANDSKVARWINVKLSPDRHELKELKAQGYRVLGVDYEKNRVTILLQADEKMIEGHPFQIESVEVLRTDRSPDERYHTYDEVMARLKNWEDAYPGLMKIASIGKTHENRDILAVKISDNVTEGEPAEPAILFNALHHAREVMTVEVALDIVEQLVTGYGSDEMIRRWVDDNEIWVIPMLNPDGNHRVWTENNMWRKNVGGEHGVDINRNYPYGWASCNGSSSWEMADDYRGPSAGSEPEVQAMMNLVAQTKPVFDISYHSFSELVLYPYGCDGRYSGDRETVEGIGKALAGKLVRDSGNGHYDPGTPWELLYAVDGGDIDWMHAEHGVIPYVIEVNSTSQGFQPDYRWRAPTVEKMRPGWQFLLDKLGGSGVRGIAASENGDVLGKGKVVATSLSGDEKTFEAKIHEDGTYHLLAPAGMYRLDFHADRPATSRDVIIGGLRLDLR